MIQEDLAALLKSIPGVISIAGARVYPMVIPEKDVSSPTRIPCLVYQFVSAERWSTTCGVTATVARRVRIDSYAKTYAEARRLAYEVFGGIADYHGQYAQAILFESGSELDLLDVEPGLYRVSQTYAIWHSD